MADFAELYPIPFALAKDRHVGKLSARTERVLEAAVSRVEIFRVQGPSFTPPPDRFRPGAVLDVQPAASSGPIINLPPAVRGLWFDIVNRSAFTASLWRNGTDLIDGSSIVAILAGVRRRYAATATGVWSALASS